MEDRECVTYDIIDYNFTAFTYNISTDIFSSFTWKECFKLIICISATIVGVIGNIGVILTVILNHSMRTTINIYLVNLAIADLMICLFCIWVHFVNNLAESHYILGSFMCKFNSFSQMTSLASSVLTLSAIACDRFVAIIFPLHTRITKQRTSFVITTIWIVSMASAVPFLIYREQKELQWENIVQKICSEKWPPVTTYDEDLNKCVTHYPSKKFYYLFITVCLFFMPIMIMLTAYTLIVWKLWISELPGNKTTANVTMQHRAKKKVIVLVCIVLTVFIVCWAPFQITLIYSEFGHSSSEYGELPEWFNSFSYFAFYLAYSNSVLNPIIYGGFNNNFRQGLCAVLQCKCQRANFKRPISSKKSLTTITTAMSMTHSNGRRKLSGRKSKIEMKFVKKADNNEENCTNNYQQTSNSSYYRRN
ncbi:QRFP-like peptide receptor [Centruroides vittatus]|uniref:QRFP-like peptide receptor n=1 Tax=Centruroides vittatus TaxID=120091 RepID=UPI00350F75AE